jgi:hypothetical protein
MPLRMKSMAKITTVVLTTPDGKRAEISGLSVQEISAMFGLNGHATPARAGSQKPSTASGAPDYIGFKKGLSDKGKRLIEVLKQNPNGISADNLAEKLGYRSANQIGGVTGGGIGKLATKHNVSPFDIYKVETTWDHGTRLTKYFPGPLIEKVA